MAKKKSNPRKPAPKKTIMTKIGGKVGRLVGELAVGKDHLMAMAGDAIESVKSTIQDITTTKKKAAEKKVNTIKKASVAKPVQTSVKKVARAATAKKAVPLKKVIKKAAKKTAKAVKKVAKKAVRKK